ncbi:MAG: nitroreductase family protein [Bacillota bacterium]|nr:nitroreductase family protein [Bacillota bacterium]
MDRLEEINVYLGMPEEDGDAKKMESNQGTPICIVGLLLNNFGRDEEGNGKEETDMENSMEIIKKRESIRTYDEASPVDEAARSWLEECMKENGVGPLGNAVRFRLLDLGKVSRDELRQLGTYGVIRGAGLYLLGAVSEGAGGMEDLGFCMERIILEATVLGLGSCWLAGTFRRSSFARQMELSEGELLPAISPIGYAAAKKSVIERMMKKGAGSRWRKPWGELFFAADGKSPLAEAEAGIYRDALGAVRLGPSASNRQPWRIIKDREGRFHLYLQENRFFNRALGKVRIQNIDMGIAMCHFSLVATAKGMPGRWVRETRTEDFPGLTHIAGWQAGNRMAN